MKRKNSSPIRIRAACLPDDIFVSFEAFEAFEAEYNIELDLLENLSGKDLLQKMAVEFLEGEGFRVFTQKNEKPKAFFDKREVSVSFSHTNDGVAAAISTSFNVGCDMENSERIVHPRLVDRIMNSREQENLYRREAPVRIWTFKEAALKMIGTGLRRPMKSVCVERLNSNEFDVEFDDGKRAKICSFQHNNHWISVCYSGLNQQKNDWRID